MKNTTILEYRNVWKTHGPEAKAFLASRAKVITAGSIAEPVTGTKFTGTVAHTDLIEQIADRVDASDNPYRVTSDVQVIGQITGQSVIDTLVGRQ